MMRWSMAALHLVALAVGFGSIWMRANALRAVPDREAIERVLRADIWWGVAALLWLGTGLARLFGGMEKATGYYLDNHIFWTKLALFVLIVVLELPQAMDFGKWRRAVGKGELPATQGATRWATFSRAQVGIVLLIILLATAMARGVG
jgi:putative membrane protein